MNSDDFYPCVIAAGGGPVKPVVTFVLAGH